jgi:hypothetical protein
MVRNSLWITATLVVLLFAFLYYTSSNQGLPTHKKPLKPAASSTHTRAVFWSVNHPGPVRLTV